VAIDAMSMPASRSCSSGVADPGIDVTASFRVTGSGAPPAAMADSTASPSPPSGQWSSTVTTRPVAAAAARRVGASIGLTE
jgi:hypothetical protein